VKRDAFHRRFTGSRAVIIPEAKRYFGQYMRGYTTNYIPVHIPYDRLRENKVTEVMIDGVENGIVAGHAVRD